METDGTWDDAKTRMNIADWAADADSSGFFATIRSNVKGWNLSDTVPNFEQFVRNFWYKEYGLDSCKTETGVVVKAATAGKRKGSKTCYICKADSDGVHRWQIASDFEKDTYLWKDTTDGALKNGDLTGAKYVFDKTGGADGTKGWRVPENIENVYGGCREALYDSIRSYHGANEVGFYLCQEKTHRWELTDNNLMIDTQGWAKGADGLSKWGDSIGVVSGGNRICYVYDTSAAYRGWRAGNDNDCTLGLGGCTKGRTDEMTLADDDDYYSCVDNTWTLVSDRVKINTLGWDCLDSNDGEVKKGLRNDAYFICESKNWREATVDEERACRNDGLCSACTGARQGFFETANESEYVCDSKSWRIANCAEKVKKSLCTANDSSLVEACEKIGGVDIDYVCSGSKWHAVEHPFDYTLEIWNAKRDAYNAAALAAKANSDSLITDPRDGKTYRTVVINGKRVFAENLRYVDSLKSMKLCYNNEAKNCEIGGAYYTWTAAVDLDSKWLSVTADGLIDKQHRGICPEGWHIPSDDEMYNLLKNISYATLYMPGFSGRTDVTDAKGFSALPVGYYRISGWRRDFAQLGKQADFLTTTEEPDFSGGADMYVVHLGTGNSVESKETGMTVRCFQDSPVE
ncbi:MAG: hypothetical protein IKO34_11165 [Bacteroidales bacterium]|nr:hypothetical protein [Bacteroidales bacterium]